MMNIRSAAVGAIAFLTVIAIALVIERINPAEPQPLKTVRFNLLYTLLYAAAQAAIVPVISVATVLAVNTAGGGWIVLPTAGWALLLGFILYALTFDLMEYLFHRAQHRIPALWAMHSFHHSDTALNASSTSRHYWFENSLKMVTIYLIAGFIFKASPAIVCMYSLLSFYNVFLHMNLRVGFGRWSVLMNSPQYHRIHHSALTEHYDCNFAALFPIFDAVFGTYRAPRDDEFPPTGIDSGDRPSGVIEAIFWPARTLIRR